MCIRDRAGVEAVREAGHEHECEGEGGVVAVPPPAVAQAEGHDEDQAGGFEQADDGFAVADEGGGPGVRRGFQQQNPQHAGGAGETQREAQGAEGGEYNQGLYHAAFIEHSSFR